MASTFPQNLEKLYALLLFKFQRMMPLILILQIANYQQLLKAIFFFFSESIVEIDSLEPDLILDDDDDEEQFEDSIRPIPAPSPIWPSPPPPPKSFIDKDTNFVADITYAIPFKDNHQKNNNDSETPPPNNQEQDSLEVNRNGHFVKSIQWRNHNRIRPLMGSSMLKPRVPIMLETVLSPIGNYFW